MTAKIVRIGNIDNTRYSLYCKITVKNGNLSITGVEGPTKDGDAYGGCGQVINWPWNITRFAPGWDAELVARFRAVWERWHLNDLRAGSPAQMEYLRANPVTADCPESYYEKACEALTAAGLQPDKGHLHNGKPYRYGSAWLREQLPRDVMEFLNSLPHTDIKPAWV